LTVTQSRDTFARQGQSLRACRRAGEVEGSCRRVRTAHARRARNASPPRCAPTCAAARHKAGAGPNKLARRSAPEETGTRHPIRPSAPEEIGTRRPAGQGVGRARAATGAEAMSFAQTGYLSRPRLFSRTA
jgi:hypothetical protein